MFKSGGEGGSILLWLFPFPCSPQFWVLSDLVAHFSGTFVSWLGKDYDLKQ